MMMLTKGGADFVFRLGFPFRFLIKSRSDRSANAAIQSVSSIFVQEVSRNHKGDFANYNFPSTWGLLYYLSNEWRKNGQLLERLRNFIIETREIVVLSIPTIWLLQEQVYSLTEEEKSRPNFSLPDDYPWSDLSGMACYDPVLGLGWPIAPKGNK